MHLLSLVLKNVITKSGQSMDKMAYTKKKKKVNVSSLRFLLKENSMAANAWHKTSFKI